MAQSIILKRSSLPGKVPDTGSLNAGELAINTYDGKIFIKRAGNVDSIQSVLTTNSTTTGSITLTQTGSFAELVTTQDGNIGRDLYVIRDIITNNDIDAGGDISGSGLQVNDTLNIIHGQFNLSASTSITGAVGISGDLTVLGAVNARQFNINVISSSIIYQSGSTKFGDTIDDSHQFTGSVDVSGSIILNGVALGGSANSGSFTGSFTGSFFGDGSGLRGVVSDDLPIDGWDYDSNSSASISDFNVTSSKYLIDFDWDSQMGTPVGHKTFISNKSGSTQVVPTDSGVKFVVENNVVATIGVNGIQASIPAGTVSGSSQLTSSYDTRYVLSGSITQTTWDNIANKPSDIVSGSSQLTASYDIRYTLSGSVVQSSSYAQITDRAKLLDIYQSNTNVDAYPLFANVVGTTGVSVLGDLDLKYNAFTNTLTVGNISAGTYLGGVVSGSEQIVGVLTSINSYTSSTDNRLNNLQTKSASVDISITNINTFTSSNANTSLNSYTGSLLNAFQVTGSRINFLGDVVIYGTQSVINSQNVEIADNILYLAPTASIDNDLGIVGHYNDGTYRHAGIFMDASDGHSWKVFNGLTTETNATIDTAGTGFTLADFKAGAFTGTSFTGQILATNGIVSGSSQVVGILGSLNSFSASQEAKDTTLASYTGSNDTKWSTLSTLTASYSSSIGQINSVTASLNSKTGSYATTGSNIFIGSQTITGSMYLSGSNNGSTPLVAFRASGTGTFQRGVQLLNPGMGNGDSIMYAVGKADNSKNMGQFYFHHAGDSSNNNRISVGLHSVDDVFNIMGSNEVLIGTTTTNSAGKLQVAGNIVPDANGTRDLGSSSYRWSTVYTSDLSLNNGIGDWTIVEGEDDLFLYNNKKGKVYKFALTEVDPSTATPKKS